MSQATDLVYTSVQDMKSSLDCAKANGEPFSLLVLMEARGLARYYGDKTRLKILEAAIKAERKSNGDGHGQ